jgi:general stress protein 26
MDSDTKKFWDMIDDIRVAMLTTDTPHGLESRPMSAYVDKAAGYIWFITRIDSDKTGEIKDDAHINLAFANSSSNKYVSVTGTARVVRDPAKKAPKPRPPR